MTIYRARMSMVLTIGARDSDTESVSFPVRVQSCGLKVNDHNKADELHVVCDWHDAGIDPRILGGGIGALHLGNADDFGSWQPTPDNLRFVGRISKAKRHGGADKPMSVELDLVDYTSFFLLAKPVVATAIPMLEQTIADAWRTLCAGLADPLTGQNAVGDLAEAIEFRGLSAPGPILGEATAKRFSRAGGRVHVDPKIDAWAIWQQCVGMCGLISYFEKDVLVVTTALDLYTAERTPQMIWGLNISDFAEERNNDFERKGVGVTSFDPLTGTTLEAVWPPVGDKRIKGKHVKPAGKKKAKAQSQEQIASKEHRDFFQFSGITDPDRLLELAKRVYAERSRQEMQGNITTAEMFVDTASGESVDLLALKSGDTVQIKIDETDWDQSLILASLPTVEQRQAYFEETGYAPGIASLLAQYLDELERLRREWYVKGFDCDFNATEEGGEFKIVIHYCNKIEPAGDTSVTNGES